ncbi:MAG: hypothetical protein DWH98_02000 [Planctomycetota bacterium]|nr:MAG: hypothetical protein DWH98_02000 [Planctomycetota bacterium]
MQSLNLCQHGLQHIDDALLLNDCWLKLSGPQRCLRIEKPLGQFFLLIELQRRCGILTDRASQLRGIPQILFKLSAG